MISTFAEGMKIQTGTFLITESEKKRASNATNYIVFSFSDKDGHFKGKKWNATKNDDLTFKPGHVVTMSGKIESYKGNLSFVADRAEVAVDVDPGVFVPTAKVNLGALKKKFQGRVNSIKEKDVRNIVGAFLNETFLKSFFMAPAAQQLHHAYLGGLLVHTMEVMEIALATQALDKNLNRDIIIAGSFLHDIGKVHEYEWKTGIQRNDEGKLLGHIPMGIMMLSRFLAHDLTRGNGLLISHIILSHHGRLEWGSPVVPSTPEAIIIHQADMVSSRLGGIQSSLAEIPEEESWSPKSWILDTKLFRESIPEKKGKKK